jgi:hypothetical protein
MEVALLNSKNKSDLKLLLEIAKKMGINAKLLSDDDKEDMGLLNAMNKGKTGVKVDTKTFLSKLKK